VLANTHVWLKADYFAIVLVLIWALYLP